MTKYTSAFMVYQWQNIRGISDSYPVLVPTDHWYMDTLSEVKIWSDAYIVAYITWANTSSPGIYLTDTLIPLYTATQPFSYVTSNSNIHTPQFPPAYDYGVLGPPIDITLPITDVVGPTYDYNLNTINSDNLVYDESHNWNFSLDTTIHVNAVYWTFTNNVYTTNSFGSWFYDGGVGKYLSLITADTPVGTPSISSLIDTLWQVPDDFDYHSLPFPPDPPYDVDPTVSFPLFTVTL